ncbi:hypothetical protein HDU93_007998 [Gonapodya sp. JEL0774]|nr:hypothetical protein HDU93_007998 [Gonapodya sp. JEL0774]
MATDSASKHQSSFADNFLSASPAVSHVTETGNDASQPTQGLVAPPFRNSSDSSVHSVRAVEFSFDSSFQRPSTDAGGPKRRTLAVVNGRASSGSSDEDVVPADGLKDFASSNIRQRSSNAGVDSVQQEKDVGAMGCEVDGQEVDDEDDADDLFLYKEDLEELLLFTKSVRPPTFFQTVREFRFIFRAIQFCVAIGSFICLSVASFDVNYPSTLIGTSGINFMCATSVSSMKSRHRDLTSGVQGVIDLRKYGIGYATGKVSSNEGWVGWARGNWAADMAPPSK